MKKIICILTLFVLQLCFGQQTYDVLVQYEMADRFRGFKIKGKNHFLLMNKEESIYFEYEENNVDYETVYSSFENTKNGFRVQHKINTDEFLFSAKYVDYWFFKDVAPEIKWQVKTDKKEILGFTCQKAVGKFRGREYTVWFTTDIPYSYGPWKLRGLPGLILEAEDSKKQHSYYATKVSLNKKYTLPIKMQEELAKQNEVLPYRVYVKRLDDFKKKGIKQVMASLPKDSNAKLEGGLRGSNPELVYEWEDEYEK